MPRPKNTQKKRVYLVFPDEDGLRAAKAMAARAGVSFSDWVLKLVQKKIHDNYQSEMTLAAGYAPANFFPTSKAKAKGRKR